MSELGDSVAIFDGWTPEWPPGLQGQTHAMAFRIGGMHTRRMIDRLAQEVSAVARALPTGDAKLASTLHSLTAGYATAHAIAAGYAVIEKADGADAARKWLETVMEAASRRLSEFGLPVQFTVAVRS